MSYNGVFLTEINIFHYNFSKNNNDVLLIYFAADINKEYIKPADLFVAIG